MANTTGTLCQQCGKAWARKTPDSDGGRRCYAHSIDKAALPPPTTRATLRNRNAILEALEEAFEAARKKKDPHGMVAAARTAVQAVQMVDPLAPEQEVGGWVVRTVARQVEGPRPASIPEPHRPEADAE